MRLNDLISSFELEFLILENDQPFRIRNALELRGGYRFRFRDLYFEWKVEVVRRNSTASRDSIKVQGNIEGDTEVS